MLSVTDGMTEMDDPALKAATLGERKKSETLPSLTHLSLYIMTPD